MQFVKLAQRLRGATPRSFSVFTKRSTLCRPTLFARQGMRRSALAVTISRGAVGARSLFVRMETTPNPDNMMFYPDGKSVLPEEYGAGMEFKTADDASNSTLARRLLKIEDITGVYLTKDFISVKKVEDAEWTAEPSADGSEEAGAEDDEIVLMIKELLDTRIRPFVQEDGGDIFFVNFDHDTGLLQVRLGGSCEGCPSSTATLKNGVENMMTHYIPEVARVEAVEEDELTKLNDTEFETLEQRLSAAGVPK